MSPERWRLVRSLFESAIVLDASERASLLRDRCAFDDTLRGEVEALLLAHERSETFLEEPAFSLGSGSRVGPYRLERQIGSGGMGAVYLASRSDGAYQSRVAIKVMRADVSSAESSARFRTERQLLATLDHPKYFQAAGRWRDAGGGSLSRHGVHRWPAARSLLRAAPVGR
jgi:serine/threonine protein kinase